MRLKIILGLGSIAVMLLLSSIISVLEYRRMSNYVQDLISANIKCINVAQKIAKMCEEHNLAVLAAIGEEGATWVPEPDFDEELFLAQCDSIGKTLDTEEATSLVDSVICSYNSYMEESSNMKEVIASSFIDSRDWFFVTLQPEYEQLRSDIDALSDAAYGLLQTNSLTFQQSFYRSIVPGMVAVGAGLLLVLLLMFYLLVYYVNPVYKMLNSMRNSGLMGTKYKCTFEGNDQLAELNEQIKDVVDENAELRRKVKNLKEDKEKLIETMQAVEE